MPPYLKRNATHQLADSADDGMVSSHVTKSTERVSSSGHSSSNNENRGDPSECVSMRDLPSTSADISE